MSARLEIHEHCFVRGPRAGGWNYKLEHSHESGDGPHQHPHTGPAAFTIDKDEWLRATGLRGGGRKKFTAKPRGEQFPFVELEAWQREFEVVVCNPPAEHKGEGPGLAPVVRMLLGHRMTVAGVRDGRK
ncbi:MAG TPA: hypothetical protein VGL73_04270 [Caulobacteraceae bacterium]|jgi:hypothetical protein